MCILKYCIRNKWWKRQVSEDYFFAHAWDAFGFLRNRVNANNGRWKSICRINSSMRIRIALCGMEGITWLTRSCCTASKMLWSFWNAWAKSLFHCLPGLSYTTVFLNSRHSQKQWPHSLCFFCSFWGASLFFEYLVPVYVEVTISSDENGAYSQMFMRHNFALKLNWQLKMESWLM